MTVAEVFKALDVPPTRPGGYRWQTQTPRPKAQQRPAQGFSPTVTLDDFYAVLPMHLYMYVPTRELWPAASVNGRVAAWPMVGSKRIRPSDWLDRNRAVEQLVWDPNHPMIVRDRVMQVSGYVRHEGAALFNLYRPPEFEEGNAREAGPWLNHLRRIYPNDADHIEKYLAYKVQNPGGKINHAIVLGGTQGIGKDTLLVPVKTAIGPWNCQDISPAQMLGRFNGWAKCVMLVINEARDLGDEDRFAFYDHSKTYLAAPPDVVRVDEKNLREHYVANVCGVIITTNHKTDGLFVPADDRRHYIAWSDIKREDFPSQYWNGLYRWYEEGGTNHVIAYLRSLELSDFDPKAPPTKTPAFWAVVQSNEAPESGELRDTIDSMAKPEAITLANLIIAAENLKLFDLANELKERRSRRAMPHKLERVGYTPVRNPDAEDGMFKVNGRRQTVYALKALPASEQIRAARLVT